MLDIIVAQLQNGLAFALLSFVAACAALEPQSSVWILAAFGSAFSAFRGAPHGAIAGLGRWVTGTFLSVVFVRVVDHMEPPEAEAILFGFISAEMMKLLVENGPRWLGGVLSNRLTGGRNAS